MMNTQFKKWTLDEETQLLDEFSSGNAISDIARKHERSIRAIEIRLSEIALRLRKSGVPSDEIFKKTGMSESDINKRISEKAQQITLSATPSLPTPYTQILMELKDIKALLSK